MFSERDVKMSHATAAKKAKGKGRATVDSSEGSSLRAHAINFETVSVFELTAVVVNRNK